MDAKKFEATLEKYKLPNHWMRDPLAAGSLPYFGYMRLVLDLLPNTPGLVLDAGCGDGRIASEIVKHGHQVVGVDFLDISVHYARLLVPEGQFHQGDLRQSLVQTHGFKPNSFNSAMLIEVYEHVPPEDCKQVLETLFEVIAPNGRLILSVPTMALPLGNLHYRHFTYELITNEVSDAGFEVETVIGQHLVNVTSEFLLGKGVENFLYNSWVQPQILKRLRRKWYMRNVNRVDNLNVSGRLIVVANHP